MPGHQVTCISRTHSEGSHEDITHIGNFTQGWRMNRNEAIRLIDSKLHKFYVVDANNITSPIDVVREEGKPPYLRSHIDGKWNDNMLSLTECPRQRLYFGYLPS